MKIKLLLIPCLISCFAFSSCEKKEDGNIQEWVGEYSWGSNRLEHWYKPVVGEDSKTGPDTEYRKDEVNLVINEDKTWKLPDKGPGKTGRIKCYKDYINLLDMQNDYVISPKFAFKLKLETGGTFLTYKHDGSDGRRGSNYNYDIRIVYFQKIK